MLRFNIIIIFSVYSALSLASDIGAVTAIATVDAGKGAYAG